MDISEKKVNLPMLNFPTGWQTVIFRNYGLLPTKRISEVLDTDIKTIEIEAERLGLDGVRFDFKWEKFGYITIIRNNWWLLNVEQIRDLLGWDNTRFENALKEDFLIKKLGDFKPQCEKITYQPLTAEQIQETEKIRKIIKSIGDNEGKPFDFFSDNQLCPIEYRSASGMRIIHGYLSPCGDVFSVDSEEYLSDSLLEEYRKAGINGLWFHANLTELSPYPFDKSLITDYKKRRKQLNRLIDRCANYNIKVYLYFNEPKALPENKIKDENLKGHKLSNKETALCLSNDSVRKYIYDAFKDLLKETNNLGGIITITMSENLTHCLSRGKTNCDKCKDVLPYYYPVLINNIVFKAIRDSGSECELLANIWGWTSHWGFDKKMVIDALKLLDKNISVICVSEVNKEIEKQGVKIIIPEYSISNVGPSRESADYFEVIKKAGHKAYAKIQVNNSWEMSAVPCLPVYDLIYEHLSNLSRLGVENYMLSWTLGGYPSINIQLVQAFQNKVSLEKWYQNTFGKDANQVHKAVLMLCKAFKNYPYSISTLYYSPKNIGYGNLWDFENVGRGGSMIGLAFDKFEGWIDPFSLEQYLAAYKQLISLWEDGLREMELISQNPFVDKVKLYTQAALLHFKADYNQTLFSFYKRDRKTYRNQVIKIIDESIDDVYELINLVRRDATIGYEASNQYFYNIRLLKEKIINLLVIKEDFKEIKI